jgi:predicted lipoprotein with Yx(FWY)xxD motif
MKTRLTLLLAGSALAVVALAGCSSSAAPAASGSSNSGGSSSKSAPITSGKDVATASTSLGTIVVDGKGMTAYFYDPDVANSGKSACTGACASLWPAITSTSATPTVAGVTAKVGTIPTSGGGHQVTIDGRPIYTYASDSKPGDVNGQGVQGIWYVVSPAGMEMKSASGTSGSGSSTGGTKGAYGY